MMDKIKEQSGGKLGSASDKPFSARGKSWHPMPDNRLSCEDGHPSKGQRGNPYPGSNKSV